MIGKNLLWAAKQHGHSVQMMLSTYAAWIEGAKEAEIEAIKRAMESSAVATRKRVSAVPPSTLESPEFATSG
jgi:hypothetical protein